MTGGEENSEPRKILEQVQGWIQAHAGTRLEDWRRPCVTDDHAPRTINKAGWRRPTEDTQNATKADQVFEYLVYPNVFKAEICQGFDPAQVVKVLLKAGVLKRGDGRNVPIKVREPGAGSTSRLYCLLPDILTWSADHD